MNTEYRTRAIITRGLCFFTLFFTAVYIEEWLVLQTIYVLNQEILQFLGLKSAVYNWERVIMARVRYILHSQYEVPTMNHIGSTLVLICFITHKHFLCRVCIASYYVLLNDHGGCRCLAFFWFTFLGMSIHLLVLACMLQIPESAQYVE